MLILCDLVSTEVVVIILGSGCGKQPCFASHHCWRNLKLIQDICFGVLSKGAMRWGCQWSLRCGVC